MKKILSTPILNDFKQGIYVMLFLFFVSTTGFSQGFPDNPTQIQETPTSPTMWEFEKYGNYPISMHTGVPNISIPIAVATSGVLKIPVSMSYHASGIKVDQKATWVGLGWNLSAGGAITRTIRGGVDESNDGYIDRSYNTSGTLDPNTDYADIEHMIRGSIDTEPDIFNYNFMGYSGKFIFNHSTSRNSAIPVMIPHNDLKVTAVFTGASITSFTIITPEGITAEFAYPETSSETRNSVIGTYPLSANITWHLKKLTAPNGIDEISFEYKTVGSATDFSVTQSESVNYYDPCWHGNYTVNTNISTSNVSYTNIKRIEKIIFNNGYILFSSTAGSRDDDLQDTDLRLNTIYVYSDVNSVTTLQKRHEFDYGYFGSTNPINPNENEVRLKLNKITERGSSGTFSNPHEFSYKDSGSYNELPDRFSYAQDYWGYYNGKNSNSSLVPNYTYQARDINSTTIYLGGADRDADPLYAQAGTLEKVTYPTLGYTIFEFENNTATVMMPAGQTQETAGGLRVNSIKNYEEGGALQWEKSYEYTQQSNSSLSSGVYNAYQFISPNDFLSIREYKFSSAYGPGSCPASGWSPPGDYSNYNDGLQPSPTVAQNFATVFYASVKEFNGSSSSHEGYTWFHYETTKDDRYQATGPLSFSIDRSWDRGQLLLQETFENGNATPIATTTNTYEEIQIQSPISAYKAGTRFDTQSLTYVPYYTTSSAFRNNKYMLLYYDNHVIWKRLLTSVTVQDGVSTQKTFSYNSSEKHTNVIKTTSTGSDNLSLETKVYYPDDITSAGFMAEGGNLTSPEYIQIDKLKKDDLHRMNTPIQIVTKKDGQVLSVQRNLFSTFNSNVFPSETKVLKGTNTLETTTIIDERDSNGNILQYHTKDGLYVSFIWGYDKTLPIAKVENVTYSTIEATTGFGSGFNIVENLSGSQETHLRNIANALVTTFDYEPLVGVIKITDNKEYSTFYEYDQFNRLKRVKDSDGKILSENTYHYKN